MPNQISVFNKIVIDISIRLTSFPSYSAVRTSILIDALLVWNLDNQHLKLS